MAEKRMFTQKIIDSDAFLDMPLSTQCLYFHLNMRADDDGFINNPKKIQRMVGSNDDDLKILIAKRFLLIFESGVIVIKHWKMHNTLQKDRYKPTQYIEELNELELNVNKSYTEKKCVSFQSQKIEELETEKLEVIEEKTNAEEEQFNLFWSLYPKKDGKKKAFTTFKSIKFKVNQFELFIKKVKRDAENLRTREKQYIPNAQTYLNREDWRDENTYLQTIEKTNNWKKQEVIPDHYKENYENEKEVDENKLKKLLESFKN